MIKIVEYSVVDKSALRKKGWKLFGAVIVFQTVLLSASYILNSV